MTQPVTAQRDPTPTGEPLAAPTAMNDNGKPRHTQTQQTLSPTSEFMRYVLAALPSRYVLRGFFGITYDNTPSKGKIRSAIDKFSSSLGRGIEKSMFGKGPRDAGTVKNNLNALEAGTYGASLGLGSMLLTHSYSQMVQRDMTNLFAETVGAEIGKDPETITFDDIKHSQNKIIQKTVENFRIKRWERFGTDLLFFPAAWMGKPAYVDAALGLKGVQLFMDTWKRKTTMFEDFVAFVNNKINPRNGLGQPITQGELFDLYQHYADNMKSVPMFTNVLERGTGEGAIWAKGQPIFQRLTELMNDTYAYKHRTELDATGHALNKADFTLPKFMYLLGHDLIDPRAPEQTLVYMEIANRQGIQAVKQAQGQLASGAKLQDVMQLYHVELPSPTQQKPQESDKNGVIHKGSTLQLDGSPTAHIDTASIREVAKLQHAQGATPNLI